MPQTWHIPSRVEGLTPKCVDSLEINKVKMEQGPPKKKKRITEGILPNVYCPVEKPISSEFSQLLIQNLKSIKSDAQVICLKSFTKGIQYELTVSICNSIKAKEVV